MLAFSLNRYFRYVAIGLATCFAIGSAPSRADALKGVEETPRVAAESEAAPRFLALRASQVATPLGPLHVRQSVDADFDATAPVLLLWPSIFADSTMYEPVVSRLPPRWRLILVDGPGHGQSASPKRSFTMAECATAMRAVLDALAVPKAFVGGTSWGGLVGGEFAILFPERTAGVVMLNAPVFVDPGGPGMGDRLIVWGASIIGRWDVFVNGVMQPFFKPETIAANGFAMREFRRHLKATRDLSGLSTAVGAVLLDREPLAPRMTQIQAPTLFVAGRDDAMYPLPQLAGAARKLPRGRWVEVESRHISAVDQPDVVARLITDFVQSPP